MRFSCEIHKQYTKVPNEAIIHVLERLVIERERWDEKLQKNIDHDSFIKFILGSDYLSDERGWSISIHEFWTNYEEIKNGIINFKDFKITKNGKNPENNSMIKIEEINSVVCFADQWNNRQNFLETGKEWIFFSWATAV